ncbi:MAG: hypothetical protein AAFQ89_24475 [Cyanobacteria bacterium J06626_18]
MLLGILFVTDATIWGLLLAESATLVQPIIKAFSSCPTGCLQRLTFAVVIFGALCNGSAVGRLTSRWSIAQS